MRERNGCRTGPLPYSALVNVAIFLGLQDLIALAGCAQGLSCALNSAFPIRALASIVRVMRFRCCAKCDTPVTLNYRLTGCLCVTEGMTTSSHPVFRDLSKKLQKRCPFVLVHPSCCLDEGICPLCGKSCASATGDLVV